VKNVLRGGVVALVAIAAVLVVGTAWAGTSAEAKKIVTFKGKYAGTAVVKVTDNVADISATGPGLGTLIGKSKVTGKGKGDASQQPCVPFAGTGVIANTKGSTIKFSVIPPSSGCGDEEGNVFSISGKAKVTGGTKLYKKAKGTLKLTGVYDRGAGSFSITFSGKITVP
jgi:hypothetical protein